MAICPEPFGSPRDYPSSGGDIGGRICSEITLSSGSVVCCLPCPSYEWFYPDSFKMGMRVSTYLNLAGVVCCCFLLLSFAVLPVEYTHRHYLSVCLTFSILLMQLSFVVPLSNNSSQCANKITPHDMFSSVNCAVSGALLLGGAWCTAMWIFLRTLSLHLQICWQMVPGRKFFLSSHAAGWSIPIAFLAVELSVTGVSFRFGDSCHINSKNDLQTFWGPLLAVAAACIVTQSITFGYCIQVYLRSLFEEKQTTSSRGSQLPYASSMRTVTAAQALRRVQRVVALQWRGIIVVLLVLGDVVYFATVFLQFDEMQQKAKTNSTRELGWLICMMENGGDKNKCLDVAAELVVKEAVSMSVLFLLSLNGIWALVLLGRPSIYPGWWHVTKKLFGRDDTPTDEFISYSVRRLSEPDPSYEMLGSKKKPSVTADEVTLDFRSVKTPEPATVSLPREYNPKTFSISQLRGRADSNNQPHSPYLDTSHVPSPYASPYPRDSDSSRGWATDRNPSYASAQPPRISTRPSSEITEIVREEEHHVTIGIAQ